MIKILILVLICGPRIIYSYFAWMRKYAKNPTKYPLEERYRKSRNLILYVFKKMHVDLKIENYDILRNLTNNTLIVGNHQSIIDIVLLISICEKPITFVAKAETSKMPFVNKILKGLEGEFLQRDDPRASLKCLKSASDKLGTGKFNLCIYPEGHRNRNPYGELLDFHPGSFKPAYWNKAQIVSFEEHGTFRILDKKYHYKRYPIFIKFNKPISYEEYSNKISTDLAPEIQSYIYKELNKLRELDNQYINEKQHLNRIKCCEWTNKYGL